MNFTYRDLGLAIFSAFLGSVKAYLVTQIKSLGAVEIFGIRSVGATCFILPIVIYYRYKLRYDLKKNTLLFIRSIIGNIAVCGYYFGFVHLPIAEASLLFYSTPIFTIIIGRLFLGEHCGFPEVMSIIISVCGVGVICVPQFSLQYSESTAVGVAGSLIGAFAQAIALALIRKLTLIPPFVVSFWWASVGILFSFGLTSALSETRTWNCGWEAMCLTFIAAVGFVSEVSLVSALKSTDAVVISLALTTEIIWAFLVQYFVLQEIPSCMTVIGGVFILVSILLPIVIKFVSEKGSISSMKNRKMEAKC